MIFSLTFLLYPLHSPHGFCHTPINRKKAWNKASQEVTFATCQFEQWNSAYVHVSVHDCVCTHTCVCVSETGTGVKHFIIKRCPSWDRRRLHCVSFPVYIIGLSFHTRQDACFRIKPMHSPQVRSDSKNLLSGFVFGIMESLIYLIWPSQIKNKVRDAHVSEMDGTCKSNFFWGGRSRGRHTGEKKKKQRLLETF